MIIEDINFTDGSIAIRINGEIDRRSTKRLTRYIKICQDIGINNIDILYSETLSKRSQEAIKTISKQTGSKDVSEASKSGNKLKMSKSTRFEYRNVAAGESDRSNNIEYCLSFLDLSAALAEINLAVTLIGRALELDDSTLSRLQLCIYELAINTVEHGTFQTDQPSIVLSITANDAYVTVRYRDNADVFLTKTELHVNISDKIKERETRGLGLFIMNQLSVDTEYKRLGSWNVTSFKVAKKESGAHEQHEKQRRIRMNTFSIKSESCDIEGATIVKLIGSIDSVSTQNVEEYLTNLLNSETKFIIIDFSEVSFISSAGIGILLGTVSSLRQRGGDLIFMKIPSEISDIFEILNISDYFVIVGSIEELKNTIKV